MAAECFLHYFRNAYGMIFAGAKEAKSPGDDAFWLALRVAVYRHLSITLGGDVVRIQYKFLICLALSRFLGECLGQIGLDLALFLKIKLLSRLRLIKKEFQPTSPFITNADSQILSQTSSDIPTKLQNRLVWLEKALRSVYNAPSSPCQNMPTRGTFSYRCAAAKIASSEF